MIKTDMIDKQTQDQVWKCAPKAFRDAVKYEYKHTIYSHVRDILNYFFGHHNLTSDTEPEASTCTETSANDCSSPAKEVARMKPITSMVSVYLATKEEDGEFRRFLHENGFKWNSGTSLISSSCWSPALEEDKIHYVYPDKTVTYCGNKTSDTLTFLEFKKQYFGENVNHRQNIANCDKQFDTILKDSFRNERRLNIATRMASAYISSEGMTDPSLIATIAFQLADALLAECEK